MIGFELERYGGDDLLRLVRTLGQHRYVASRMHLVHAFAVESAGGDGDAADWARRALSSGAIDLASKDERLYRRVSDDELGAVLAAFWGDGDREHAAAAKGRLRERLRAIDAVPHPDASPFDESREDGIFPVLIDAGWELLPLAQLDRTRHKGAIESFDDFEVARFDEESAIPPLVTLHELPVLGAVELLHAFDDAGKPRAPFVLWQQGHETYLDYVLRGVLRAAKLSADLG
jgi:hypothetical protein